MFDVNDKDSIIKLIESRRTNDEVIIPVYVRVGNKVFSLTELDDITNCSPSIFKIGFGTSDSIFVRNKFPKNRLIDFYNVKLFTIFDDDKQCAVEYITFESSDVNGESVVDEQINKWYYMILEHVMNHVNELRKEAIKNIMNELS